MTNIDKTEHAITLEGHEYVLAYPFPALWAFEDATGVEIFSDEQTEQDAEQAQKDFDERVFGKTKRVRMQRIALLLWAGLITKQPDITKEKAQSFVYPHNMLYVREQVIKAFSAAIAGPQKEEASDPSQAANASV